MNTIGKPERETQNRIIALFRDNLKYRYFGDFTDRQGNSNIEEGALSEYLTRVGYSAAQISRAPSTCCASRRTTRTAASMTTTGRSIPCSAMACR